MIPHKIIFLNVVFSYAGETAYLQAALLPSVSFLVHPLLEILSTTLRSRLIFCLLSHAELIDHRPHEIFDDLEDKKSISPAPNNFSAPEVSITVLESICEETWKVILDGTLALIKPVITSTDGLCVANTR